MLRKVLDVFSDLWGVDLRSSTHIPAARHPPRSGGLKPHYDTTDVTGVVYLHSTPEGTGELHFPLASPELTWAPKAGAMVTWANNVLLKNGTSVLVEEAAHLVTPGTNATGQPRYTLNLNANFLRPKPDRRLLFADKQGGPLPGTLVGFDGLEAGLPSRKSLFSAAAGLSMVFMRQTKRLMRTMNLARMPAALSTTGMALSTMAMKFGGTETMVGMPGDAGFYFMRDAGYMHLTQPVYPTEGNHA